MHVVVTTNGLCDRLLRHHLLCAFPPTSTSSCLSWGGGPVSIRGQALPKNLHGFTRLGRPWPINCLECGEADFITHTLLRRSHYAKKRKNAADPTCTLDKCMYATGAWRSSLRQRDRSLRFFLCSRLFSLMVSIPIMILRLTLQSAVGVREPR